MAKTLVEMAAEIVQSQCGSSSMTPEDVASALDSTFKALQSLQCTEASGATIEQADEGKPSTSPARSILKNKVICLECGQEFKSLTNKHFQSHGLTGKEYRKKYGFKMSQPLCAKSLTASRKAAAKERGLPEKLQQYIDSRKKSNVTAAPTAKKKTTAPKKRKGTKKAAAK